MSGDIELEKLQEAEYGDMTRRLLHALLPCIETNSVLLERLRVGVKEPTMRGYWWFHGTLQARLDPEPRAWIGAIYYAGEQPYPVTVGGSIVAHQLEEFDGTWTWLGEGTS